MVNLTLLFVQEHADDWIMGRSFVGYSNANYALSEIRDPVRTIKKTAPLAMLAITLIYMLVNVAYYAVVDQEEILGSGRIAAALFFGKLWGLKTERVSQHGSEASDAASSCDIYSSF